MWGLEIWGSEIWGFGWHKKCAVLWEKGYLDARGDMKSWLYPPR